MAKQIKIVGALKGVSIENNILLAIHRHCTECMGGNKKDVENCQAITGKSRCLLWEYRQGPLTTAERNKQRLLYVINAYCKQCLVGEDVRNCTADKSSGLYRCGLFELRNVVESD